MPTQSPREQGQTGGSAAPSPPQGRRPPCGRVLHPVTEAVVTNGHLVHNNVLSDYPRHYCPSPVCQNIVSVPSRVGSSFLSLTATPKHTGEGGTSAALGPVANAQPTQGRGSPGAAHHRHAGQAGRPAPGCQMDVRRTCCWSHFNQPNPLDPR